MEENANANVFHTRSTEYKNEILHHSFHFDYIGKFSKIISYGIISLIYASGKC